MYIFNIIRQNTNSLNAIQTSNDWISIPIIGIAAADGKLSAITNWNTVNDKRTVVSRETFSPDSAGSKNPKPAIIVTINVGNNKWTT